MVSIVEGRTSWLTVAILSKAEMVVYVIWSGNAQSKSGVHRRDQKLELSMTGTNMAHTAIPSEARIKVQSRYLLQGLRERLVQITNVLSNHAILQSHDHLPECNIALCSGRGLCGILVSGMSSCLNERTMKLFSHVASSSLTLYASTSGPNSS